MNATIEIDGCTVRVVTEPGLKLDVPRRQGFAWAKNARAYAEALSAAHGWPITEQQKTPPSLAGRQEPCAAPQRKERNFD